MLDLGIDGKVALVSGGSRGIGRARTERLLAEGCKVMIVARGKDGVESAVSELSAQRGNVAGINADLATAAGVAEAVTATQKIFGAPDIVISNVHGGMPGDILSEDCSSFFQAYESLLMGVVHLARAVLPAMKAKHWGRLLVLGSATAKEPRQA